MTLRDKKHLNAYILIGVVIWIILACWREHAEIILLCWIIGYQTTTEIDRELRELE